MFSCWVCFLTAKLGASQRKDRTAAKWGGIWPIYPTTCKWLLPCHLTFTNIGLASSTNQPPNGSALFLPIQSMGDLEFQDIASWRMIRGRWKMGTRWTKIRNQSIKFSLTTVFKSFRTLITAVCIWLCIIVYEIILV